MKRHDRKTGVGLWATVGFIFSVIGALGVVAVISPEGPVELAGAKLHFPDLKTMLANAGSPRVSVDEQLSRMEESMNLNADSIAAADSAMSARADSLRRRERIFGKSESRSEEHTSELQSQR